jgi:hypothetical protein
MDTIGVTNAGWGVCGFTSTLYAMYALNPGVRGQVINATEGYRVLAEIKTYLVMLKAENSPHLKAIRDFTRSFGKPHDKFEIDKYITRINEAAGDNLTVEEVLANEKFGIATPPAAVADYVARAWGWRGTVEEFPGGGGHGDGIIGVRSSTHTSGLFRRAKPYHGLEHWMYRWNGSVYSWGQRFTDVAAAAAGGAGGAPWTVCYVVRVTRA